MPLQALYKKYGWYGEKTHNLVMPGLDGLEKMAALMKSLRAAPPAAIADVPVVVRKDYQDGTATDCATGAVTAMELKGSNVLRFELADGTTILVRPSGTGAQDQGLYPHPGRGRSPARREPGQILRLGRHPDQIKR